MMSSRARTAFLFIGSVGALVVLGISVSTIAHEVDSIAHHANSTQGSRCFEVSKAKLNEAKVNIIAAITINTLAIAVCVLVVARVCTCICACVSCSDSCKRACNWILVGCYVALVLVIVVTLDHVDPSCKKLSTALLMLLIVVPLTCGPLLLVARAGPDFDNGGENLLESQSNHVV